MDGLADGLDRLCFERMLGLLGVVPDRDGRAEPPGRTMKRFDVVVVGGGIAGLGTAWQLSKYGGVEVCLLEREPLFASHASGRNAAIFRQVEGDLGDAELARRSEYLLSLLGEGSAFLRRTGAVYIGAVDALRAMGGVARGIQASFTLLDEQELVARVPLLAGGEIALGLWMNGDGVLDVHGLVEALVRAARAQGASLENGAAVSEIRARRGRVLGVRLADGREIDAGVVVIAAGAWAAQLGGACGASIHLESMRRHLVSLVVDGFPRDAPVVWRLDSELYFRPEAGGALASPCDEEPWPCGVPPCSEEQLVRLAVALHRTAPTIARKARVRRAWACLRTVSTDRKFVVGEDPDVRGLFWIAGLGGRGMTCGLAAAEVVARDILGVSARGERALSPSRFRRR